MTISEKRESLGVREKQKDETKEKILLAALEVFAERGFEGASVREIATRAGIIHGLIKYHFENKNRLWREAVNWLFERQANEMRDPPGYAELSPFERARSWIRRYVHYSAKHPEHARIMVQESIRDSDRLRWAVETHIKPAHEAVYRNINEFKASGVYPEISKHSLIYIITAAAQAPFMLSAELQLSEGLDPTSEKEIDAYADALWHFLFVHKARPAGS